MGHGENNTKKEMNFKFNAEHTFFTSDTHFNHANIIRFCNRPFKDVEQMNEVMIANWNNVIGKDDTVFHLGDFCLGAAEWTKILDLDRNVDNVDLVALSRLQDSLTYFITSIRGNENLLSKLKFKLPVDELDADMIEDVNIEMSQARETTNIYSNILESTMETYANIINNNMSKVMKMLTSISIILMFPTLIASLFGMNLINGMESWTWGFPIAFVLCIVTTVLFFWYFKRKSWF